MNLIYRIENVLQLKERTYAIKERIHFARANRLCEKIKKKLRFRLRKSHNNKKEIRELRLNYVFEKLQKSKKTSVI